MSELSATPSLPVVFVSYSRKDAAWKDRLATQLQVLEGVGVLDAWDDSTIGPGEDWRAATEAAMNRAAVAILLISADALSRDFLSGQGVDRLLARRQAEGLRVILVICRPCAWRQVPWLSAMAVRPADGRPLSSLSESNAEEAFAALAEEVAQLLGKDAP